MQLSKNNLAKITGQPAIVSENLFNLPEKVVQFGTGVLLRALPDYFIDKANKQGLFNGRVVVVKSTDGSDADAFTRQNNLYTICVRGIENSVAIKENIVNTAISRVLNAKSEWSQVLSCAHNKNLQTIISNTTEVGLRLQEDSIAANPPVSFPGKLLAFLYERYTAFNGAADAGMVIVPTELITDNGTLLKNIVVELAYRNRLNDAFITWLQHHNRFCNSLVDRIVPGKPAPAELKLIEEALGYTDELLTISEVFRLWAIEGDEKVKAILSFCKADPGVVITPNITLYKELKLRLLNGTHTFTCGVAHLAGFMLTREAVTDKLFAVFIKQLMQSEIAPSIPVEIDAAVKTDFASKVFERFCNPAIDHQWLSITMQYASKMNMRNVPLLQHYFENNNRPPVYMTTAFAAFLLFMKAVKNDNGKYLGQCNDAFYEIRDDTAAYFYKLWQQNDITAIVKEVLANEALWQTNLAALPGFCEAVTLQLKELMEKGARSVVAQLVQKNEMAT
jgi:tagaturonate reductase